MVAPEIVEQFIFEFLGTPRYAQWNIKLHFSEYTGEWNIEGKSYDGGNVKAYSTYGTKRINAYKIIEETLNLKDVRIFDYVEDSDGKKKAILNKRKLQLLRQSRNLLSRVFRIGFGQSRNAVSDCANSIMRNSTVFAPVSMTEVISLSME